MDMKEVAKFETPVRLKLSEAIRIGAKLTPHCTNGLYVDFTTGATCALGAAYVGRYGFPTADAIISVIEFADRAYPRPGLIMGWNDDDKLTREQIADWLEAQGY